MKFFAVGRSSSMVEILISLTRNGFQNYVSGSRKSGTKLHKRDCDFGITKETLAPLKT
jgi:hypothetical protein